jgi:hypothetical protein
MSLPVSRPYLLAASALVGGTLLVHRSHDAAPAAAPRVASKVTAPTATPPPPSLPPDEPMLDDDDDDNAADVDDEEIHGFHLDGPDEFAMVFSLNGRTYLQLSTDEAADEHKYKPSPRLTAKDDNASVVDTVPLVALPEQFRHWAGRHVVVDGTCEARVVGFAEVSRASGEPPANEWEDDKGEWHREEQPWTVEVVTQANTVLAAELSGCTGTWARATDLPPALVADATSEPELEQAARADLLARIDHDPAQDDWKQQGGEGAWQDAADVKIVTYRHPVTGEAWVFVQAEHPGGCGDPWFSKMAAYRTGVDGTLQRVADLSYGSETISSAVDVDGDGQPELVMGTGSAATLIDLKGESAASISVPYLYEGCGC